MRRALIGCWAVVMLVGCGDLFLNPPVECPARSIDITLTTTPLRSGQPCIFGDFPFSVAYGPKVDIEKDPNARDYALVGGRVTLTAGSSAVRLCAGSAEPICTDGQSELTATIGATGVLSYQGILSTELLTPPLQPGGSYKGTSTLVTENFGPGNTCAVSATFDFSCQQPVK